MSGHVVWASYHVISWAINVIYFLFSIFDLADSTHLLKVVNDLQIKKMDVKICAKCLICDAIQLGLVVKSTDRVTNVEDF